MTILHKEELVTLSGVREINDVLLDMRKVEQFVLDGLWTKEDLDAFGLVIPEPFVVPEGKTRVGGPTYVKEGDTVREVYATVDKDAAPPVVRDPPTRDEKITEMLAGYNLTLTDLRDAIAGLKTETEAAVR